jgi:hypothetical protein
MTTINDRLIYVIWITFGSPFFFVTWVFYNLVNSNDNIPRV